MPRDPILNAEAEDENQERIGGLIQLLRSGEAIAFIGAGCSIGAGFPSWPDFMKQLEDIVCGWPSRVRFQRNSSLRDANPLAYADQLYAHIVSIDHKPQYQQWLQTTFESTPPVPSLSRWIVSLPFRGILTTNYENLLERALSEWMGSETSIETVNVQSDTPLTISRAVRHIVVGRRPSHVIDLHGFFRQPETMVVTDADYQRAYGIPSRVTIGFEAATAPTSALTPLLLSSLLITRSVVFLGFSLNDPYLVAILDAVTRTMWSWGQGLHFAIFPVPAGGANAARVVSDRYKSQYGIEAIFYETRAADFRALEGLLQRIASELNMPSARGLESPLQPAHATAPSLTAAIPPRTASPASATGVATWSSQLTSRNIDRLRRA